MISKEAASAVLAIIISYPTSESGIIVLLNLEDRNNVLKENTYNNNNNNNDNNNDNKMFITVSMYLAQRANWGHLLLQN